MVAGFILMHSPSTSRAQRFVGTEWLGSPQAVYVVKSVIPEGDALHVPEIRVTDERMSWPIYVVGTIRKERPTSGTIDATAADLRPGVRIRAHGNHGTSPMGFIADTVLILKH